MKVVAFQFQTGSKVESFFNDDIDAKAYEKYLVSNHFVPARSDIIRETRPGELTNFVWVVEGDDRYYDEGGTWLVGVYSNFQKALVAQDKDETMYNQGDRKFLSYNIYQIEIDKE